MHTPNVSAVSAAGSSVFRGAGLWLSLCLAGCGGGTPKGDGVPDLTLCPQGFAPTPSSPSVIGVQGHELDVPVALGTCHGVDVDTLGLDVEVLDEAGQVVSALAVGLDAGPLTDAGRRELTAGVRFTPTALGPHYVRARFLPGLGIVQRTVPIAEDHSDAGRVAIAHPAALDCFALRPLEKGGHLCRVPNDGGVAVVRQGVEVQRFSGSRAPLSIRGDEVWLAQGRIVTHWWDVDGGALSPEGAIDAGGLIRWMAATETRTAVVGTWLGEPPSFDWGSSSSATGQGHTVRVPWPMVFREPWFTQLRPMFDSARVANGGLWLASNQAVCRRETDGGHERCLRGSAMGVDSEAAWFASAGRMTRFPLEVQADGGLVPEASGPAPTDWAVQLTTRVAPSEGAAAPPLPANDPQETPWLTRTFGAPPPYAGFVYRPQGEALVLEWYGHGLTPLHITSRTLWVRTDAGVIWEIARP